MIPSTGDQVFNTCLWEPLQRNHNRALLGLIGMFYMLRAKVETPEIASHFSYILKVTLCSQLCPKPCPLDHLNPSIAWESEIELWLGIVYRLQNTINLIQNYIWKMPSHLLSGQCDQWHQQIIVSICHIHSYKICEKYVNAAGVWIHDCNSRHLEDGEWRIISSRLALAIEQV